MPRTTDQTAVPVLGANEARFALCAKMFYLLWFQLLRDASESHDVAEENSDEVEMFRLRLFPSCQLLSHMRG
jgi:hypothetical protein